MAKHKGDDYEVGYGKPPVEHRFKKGKSGNPKGRPRHRMNRPNEAMQEALMQMVQVRIQGAVRNMTALEAIQHQMVRRAMNGDAKMIQMVMNSLPPALRDVEPEEIIEYTLSLDPPKPASKSDVLPISDVGDDD